jgi:hypothetical protein
MPVRIIFSLQSPQPGQPPSLISVQLLQGLVTVRIVHVRVHLSAPISLVQSFTEVFAKGDSVAVQCAIHMVADDRGSNRLALYHETKGREGYEHTSTSYLRGKETRSCHSARLSQPA